MRRNDRKIILGLGNLLFSDEGFGIHALRYLRTEMNSQFQVEWVDGGVLGLNLLPLIEESSHLLVLDAVDAGLAGGSLVEITGEQMPLFTNNKMSEHQIGFQEVLALARLRDRYPAQLHLVGVQPANMAPGVELSPAVKAALPAVARRAAQILIQWTGLQ